MVFFLIQKMWFIIKWIEKWTELKNEQNWKKKMNWKMNRIEKKNELKNEQNWKKKIK